MAVLLTLCAHAAAAQTRQLRSVVVLFANRTTALAAAEMEPAFRRSLEPVLGAPVDMHVEYLDLVEGARPGYEGRLVDLLREKYRDETVDMVLPIRPESLGFVLRHRDVLFRGAPVVFADISREDLGTVQLPPDVTGVVQPSIRTQRTVSVALDLHPAARRVVLVAGASAFDRAREAATLDLVRARDPKIEVVSLAGQPLGDQLRALASLSSDSVVIFISYRADSMGRSMIAANILRLVVEASGAPVYGAVQAWLGMGIVGGDLIRYGTIAERAAGVANRVFRGEPVSSIPPVEVSVSDLMFDWRQLRRWGIDERLIPAGSIVMFREPTLFEAYRWYVLGFLGVALTQAVLIGALLIERRVRHRAVEQARTAERSYRTVADFNYDWEYWERPDGSYAYVSPSVLRVTGHDAQEFYERPALTAEMVVPEDRARWDDHASAARAGSPPGGMEFRITTAAGEVRWIEHMCTPVTEDNRFSGVRGSNRDITDRKRAEEDLRRAFAEIQQLRDQLEVENTYLSEELKLRSGIEGIVGVSDAIGYVLGKAKQVAGTSSTVLLLGETGVGKDMVATAIHNMSPRRARPLVRVNCAALPPPLIESELFGHEKGAFTGATAQRKGRFEVATGSSLFLDEVGELPLDLQAKLLRVLQDGDFERVGSNVTLHTDARIIAATNRNLLAEVKAGRFREDLWYRLNVFPITVPPLRQRPEDIPLLVRHLIEKHCRRMGRAPLDVTRATMKDLETREWVGNVRELESVIERAVITSQGTTLQLTNETGPGGTARSDGPGSTTDVETLADAERKHIVAMLERTGWRLAGAGGAAELLGINPSTLRSRMQKLGIRRPPHGPYSAALPDAKSS